MPTIRGQVATVTPLTDRIVELRLQAVDGAALPVYEPGSHVRVTLPDGSTRAYSLIRFEPLPDPVPEYRIAVQLEEPSTGGSKFMHQLKVGGEIEIAEPKNDFPLVIDKPAVLLAGGIGVTPIISMATALDEAGQPFEFHYSGRSAGLMAFRDALRDRFGDALHLHCDDAPDALDLKALVAEVGDRHLYVCGPRGMIDAARELAEGVGIPRERIHFELFDSAQPEEGDTAFEVELASTGDVFTVAPGQSIIEALEAGGVDVMYDCQRGDCGICQCEVIDGIPDHRDVVLSEDERASNKVMQICVSRAKTPRLVLDI